MKSWLIAFTLIFSFTKLVFGQQVDHDQYLIKHSALDAKALAEDWTWIREDSTLWRFTPEGLQIKSNGSLWNEENTQKNILILQQTEALANGFIAEILVDGHLAMTGRYEHVGLIFYQDDDNWVTLTLLNHVQDGTQKIMLVPEEKGRGRANKSIAIPYLDRSVVLRMVFDRHSISAYYRSPDIAKWTFLGQLKLANEPTGYLPGLVSGYNGVGAGHWLTIKSFGVFPLK